MEGGAEDHHEATLELSRHMLDTPMIITSRLALINCELDKVKNYVFPSTDIEECSRRAEISPFNFYVTALRHMGARLSLRLKAATPGDRRHEGREHGA